MTQAASARALNITDLHERQRDFRDSLVGAGLLLPSSVPGVYGHGAEFTALTAAGRDAAAVDAHGQRVVRVVGLPHQRKRRALTQLRQHCLAAVVGESGHCGAQDFAR